MKNNKSEIVRVRDGGTAEQVAAPEGNMQQTNSAGTNASGTESGGKAPDSALYGGDSPIQLDFPWRFADTLFAYIAIPAFVLFLVVLTGLSILNTKDLRQDWGNLLLGGTIFSVLAAWGVYSWYARFYRKRERSITVDPVTKTFHVRNFVLTRGKHLLPHFYPELTFTLDDVRKIYYRLPDYGAVYIVVPEGYFLVGVESEEFLRMKYFIYALAPEKYEQTSYRTLDGAIPMSEDF